MNSLIYIFIGGAIIFLLNQFVFNKKNNIKNSKKDYTKSYTQKWMFTYNEKDAYYKIKTVTEKLGYHLFAKVRLYDLIEPAKGNKEYKSLQFKIQAKHVDFVICDEKLVARTIIEIDDASHNRADRQERDQFVDSVLKNCGYKVLRYISIIPEVLENDLKLETQKS